MKFENIYRKDKIDGIDEINTKHNIIKKYLLGRHGLNPDLAEQLATRLDKDNLFDIRKMSAGMYDEMIKEIIADTIKSYKAKGEVDVDVEAIRRGEKDEHLTTSANSNNQQVSEEEQKRKEEFERNRQEAVRKLQEQIEKTEHLRTTIRKRKITHMEEIRNIEETEGIKKYH